MQPKGLMKYILVGGLEPWNFMFPYWDFHHPN